MKKITNECVGCTDLGLHCLGNLCHHRNVTRYYCDDCGEEQEQIYYYDGEELCLYCIEKRLEKVE